ncbi:MAG: hypothetical protein HZA58_05510 [Acidimicrobiia bacterium]|nr:hypothetical protein [Acidimicrobiia bacterium]
MPSLGAVLERRLCVVTGKGGTGKSAVAASLAIAAGRRGMRVLALAMGDGDGLARHLGAPRLGPSPEAFGDVHAAVVEPASALDEYLRHRIRIPHLGAVARIFAAVVDTVPGIRDTVMIGKVVHDSTLPAWDLVVADAPPTGQVQSYLGAPETIAGLVPGGAVRDQAAWLRSLLQDPEHTGVVVVATPEELPVTEAMAFRDHMADTTAVAAVIANKVLPEVGFDAAAIAGIAPGPALEAARFQLALTEAQHRHLAELRPDRVVSLLFGMHTPDETASRIADLWELP